MAGTPWNRTRRRRPGRSAALVLGAVLLVLGIAAPLIGVPAARTLESGVTSDVQRSQADLQQGLKLLEEAYKNQDPGRVDAASASFIRSRDRLQALARRLRSLDAARAPASPGVIRSRLLALDAVIDVAIHLDHAGTIAAQALLTSGLVSKTPPAPGTSLAGTAEAAAKLTDLLASIREDVRTASRSAASIDIGVLPAKQQPTFKKARDELHTAAIGLDALWPSLGAVLDLLGLNGPRTYLIEQTNPAELRSGGGFIGTVSLVHADMGRVTLAKSVPVETFDYCDAAGCVHPRPQPGRPGYVAPPAELTGTPLPPQSRLTAWSLEDSGFYPDFASNATTAETFARKLLNVPIDGVVAVDYYAVAPLLELTGPIVLDKYHLTLTAANFVDTIVGLDLARDYAHKDIISAAAAQIVAKLSHAAAADLPKLVQILEGMVRGRHLQVHFDQAAVEHETGRLGATEVLNPRQAADFLLETEDNYGGSKANFFLDRKFSLELTQSGGVLQHRLTIDLHDRAPADKPFIGPHYYAYLRATVPANATKLTVSSAKSQEYAPIQAPARRTQVAPNGSQVTGGWIFVLVGQGYSGRYQATFTWETPWAPGPDGSAVMYWQKQPGTVHDAVHVTWNSAAGSRSATGDLSEDRLVTLRPDGVALSPVPAAGTPPVGTS